MTEFSRKAQLMCWMAYLLALPASWSWLPEMVGESSKQITKDGYIAIMLATALPLPWVMGGGLLRWLQRNPSLLNLPHKDYWLDPQRADATWTRLDRFLQRLGWMIWSLLALIHYRAVAERPGDPRDQAALPALPETAFEITMLTLVILVLADALGSTLAWRVPKAQLQAFRARQMPEPSHAAGKRSIRRPAHSSPSALKSGHGEPR
jgi:hypothetical protein